MAEFGTRATDLSAPQGAGAQVLQGIESPASTLQIPSGAIDLGNQLAATLREDAAAKAKLNAKQQENAFLSSYTKQATALSQTAAQQGLNPAEVSVRLRNLNDQYLVQAAEAGYLDSFKKAQDLVMGTSSTGQTVSESDAARKNNMDFLAKNNVYVPPGASDQDISTLTKNQQAINRDREQYAENSKRIADNQRDTGFNQAQADRARKEQAIGLIASNSGKEFDSLRISTDRIVAQVRSGAMTIDQGNAELTRLRGESEAKINAISAYDPSVGTTFKGTLGQLFDVQFKRLTSQGEEDQSVITALVNRSTLTSLQKDPKLIQFAAVSELFGKTLPGQVVSDQMAGDILARMTAEDTTSSNSVPNVVGSPSNKTTETAIYASAKIGLASAQAGDSANPAKMKEESFRLTNNVMDQLGDKYGSRKVTSADLKDVSQFMASPEFAYFVKEGGMRADVAETAKKAYMQLYRRDIDNGIQQQLSEKIPVGARNNRPEDPAISGTTMDAVDIRFSNGAIQFVPKSGQEYSSESIRRVVQERIRDLQTTQSALTQIVRIGAHLEGTTDYQAYWEKNKSSILPYYYGNPEKLKGDKIAPDGTVYRWIGGDNGDTRDRRNWQPVPKSTQ